MEYLMLAIVLVIGIAIGVVVTSIISSKSTSGRLVIDEDPLTGDQYMYLALDNDKELEDLQKKHKVAFKVDVKG